MKTSIVSFFNKSKITLYILLNDTIKMRKNKGVIFSELFKALKSKMDAILVKCIDFTLEMSTLLFKYHFHQV